MQPCYWTACCMLWWGGGATKGLKIYISVDYLAPNGFSWTRANSFCDVKSRGLLGVGLGQEWRLGYGIRT